MRQLLLSISLLLFISCGESFFYKNKIELPSEGWAHDTTINFDFEIKDTTQWYDLFLDVEHTDTYPFQNLYYYVHTKTPSGQKPKKLISSDLANKAGYWFGQCSGPDCQLRIVMQENLYFDELGTYTIGIEQYTRDSLLTGIQSLSLKLKSIEPKKHQ